MSTDKQMGANKLSIWSYLQNEQDITIKNESKEIL